jgi:hypothetical protein
MNELVCHCFKFSAAGIQADVRANAGRSLILEKIIAEKKAGTCQCETTHPRAS